jgi:hypothetical protein
MKKQIFTLLLIAITGTSYAQCDKRVFLTAKATEYLDANNVLQKTVDEITTVEFDTKTISIMPGEHHLEGTINSVSCDWKTPFKEGKTVIKGSIANPMGDLMTCTITIEGKEGKQTFVFEAEETPDKKIRLVLDKFEEKK